MKETMRRLLSLVLAWVMLLSMTPLSALAADGDYYGTYSLDGISVRARGTETVRVGEEITITGTNSNDWYKRWSVISGDEDAVSLSNADERTVTVTGVSPGTVTLTYQTRNYWNSSWTTRDMYTVVVEPASIPKKQFPL